MIPFEIFSFQEFVSHFSVLIKFDTSVMALLNLKSISICKLDCNINLIIYLIVFVIRSKSLLPPKVTSIIFHPLACLKKAIAPGAPK